ncbi:MAG TPA: Sec-independent protein translocase protein TatB [Rhodomicrobium sp.]|nr:Sec-independent protein translocase protein TatB [Rhodomicrobium sp.]
MFDIAWSELLLIAVIALIFIGPKELPQVLHTLGRMTAKLRRSADDFRRQFEDTVREAGYEDLHKNIQEFRSLNPANQLKDSIARAINQDYAPKPVASAPQAPMNQPPAVESKPREDEPQQPARASPAEANAPDHTANVASMEKPNASAPQAPAEEPAKDRIAPAA